MKTGNTEVKNPHLKDGSSEKAGGSQRDFKEYNENEAKIEQVFNEKAGDSALTNEHENSQNRAGSIKNMSPAIKEPSTQKIKSEEKTTNRVEETDAQKPCACGRFCERQDLKIKDPRVIFKLLGEGEKDIFHTIKWLEEIHINVERE